MIKLGMADELRLGNLDAKRDWGYAKFYRPAEVQELMGDYSKAKEKLGWEREVSFEDLITMMVDSDLARLTAKG